MKSIIIYYSVKAILYLLALLPLPINHKLGTFIGLSLYFLNTKARKISEINVKICMPDLSTQDQQQLIKNSLIELGKSFTELGPLWLWENKKILSLLQVEGRSIAESAINNGNGVILITPHLGCWEIAGLYLGQQWPTSIFYQTPKIKSLDPIIRNARARSGAQLLATDKKGLTALLKTLKAGGSTGILPDQTPKNINSGTFAPFFGQPALTINLISTLSKKTNCVVLIGFAKRLANGKGYTLRISQSQAEIDSPDHLIATTALNQSVEKLIAQAPEQYLWSYKRFKKVPQGIDKIY